LIDEERTLQTSPTEKDVARVLIAADGARVAYRIADIVATATARAGETAGPLASKPAARSAVLLLHGLASNLTRWSEFVETTSLTESHCVIRVDLRGHGDSTTRRPISLELWCEDLAAILAQEGVARVTLIGHSLGAQVALHFAALVPAARRGIGVRGVALIDPVFRAALHGRLRWYARAGPVFRAAAMLTRAANSLGLYRRHLPQLDLRALDVRARAALASPQTEAEFVRRYSSTRADLKYVPLAVYLQDLVEMFRAAPQFSAITVPVLALLSTGATFADDTVMRAALARFANVRIETIECHHWPLTERPAEVRTALERWVAALD